MMINFLIQVKKMTCFGLNILPQVRFHRRSMTYIFKESYTFMTILLARRQNMIKPTCLGILRMLSTLRSTAQEISLRQIYSQSQQMLKFWPILSQTQMDLEGTLLLSMSQAFIRHTILLYKMLNNLTQQLVVR